MKADNDNSIGCLVDEFLSSQSLPTSAEHACPYLPDLQSKNEGFAIDDMPGELYRVLLDRGFRRSGRLVYRPVCGGCRACRQIRIPVLDFAASRSQRRVLRRNRDIEVTLCIDGEPTEEKWRVFHDYVTCRHDDQMAGDYETYVEFLHTSPIQSIELAFRVQDRLAGVSIVDVCADAWSSVYMYFDPELQERSLGTFSILWEMDYCRRMGISYYYLGYFVAGSKNMAYKARFRPHELLDETFTWHRTET